MSPAARSTLAGIDDLAAALRERAAQENFPVALRLLPGELKAGLVATYDVARTIDTIGDELPGGRLAMLADFERDLMTAWSDKQPVLSVNRALQVQVQRHGLTSAPFHALVEANRWDQQRSRYETWAELQAYCTLSANPVGHVVLELAGARDPQREAWSDDVCTALQLLEHCQDVAEDARAGRVYLPADELATAGAIDADLVASTAGVALRRVILDQVARARELLRSGPPLVHSLPLAPRIAVAGFVAGGLATADALAAANGDVLASVVRPRRSVVVRHLVRLSVAGR